VGSRRWRRPLVCGRGHRHHGYLNVAEAGRVVLAGEGWSAPIPCTQPLLYGAVVISVKEDLPLIYLSTRRVGLLGGTHDLSARAAFAAGGADSVSRASPSGSVSDVAGPRNVAWSMRGARGLLLGRSWRRWGRMTRLESLR